MIRSGLESTLYTVPWILYFVARRPKAKQYNNSNLWYSTVPDLMKIMYTSCNHYNTHAVESAESIGS